MVLGSSDIHLENKLRMDREKAIQMGVESVKYAKKYCPDVEYSTEDASRADFEFLCRMIEEVIKAGATVINIPDTVGYAVPEQYGAIIKQVREKIPITDKVTLSVHCHNDLGLATSNTLSAIKNGATQVECTVNSIGERAGNTAMEEVVMALKVRSDYYDAYTDIKTTELMRTSKMVSRIMNIPVQPNKAIIGSNAFAHSSGIHQDGILKNRATYEIIKPEDVGVTQHKMVLTARS
jgi:2-isopropylmalate synthase